MQHRIKTFLKDYFTFTSRERRGIIVLMTILLLVIAFPYLWNIIAPPKMKPLSEFKQQVAFSDVNKNQLDSSKNDNSETKSTQKFTIEINGADSLAFEQVNGIKKYIAARIVKYRHALGGFYAVAQLKEIYGLKPELIDSNLSHFSVDISRVKKININTTNDDELRHHPYIGYSLAKVIVAYREQHGSYTSVEDLKKIAIVTPEMYQKLLPYLTVQ